MNQFFLLYSMVIQVITAVNTPLLNIITHFGITANIIAFSNITVDLFSVSLVIRMICNKY